jgi:SAM-dependent methyltransferase
MNNELPVENEQARLWNGPSGQAWIDLQDTLDRALQPIEDLLVNAVAAQGAQQVLDVGCGTGATTLAIARQLATRGRCVGIDISDPMIAVARSRAEREGSRAQFVCADAQTHTFEPATFDSLVSRFGVMFFDAPVQAFSNLRHAAKAGDVRVRRRRPRSFDPAPQRLGRHSHPADRRDVHDVRERSRPLRRPPGPSGARIARGRRTDARTRDRHAARSVCPLCARRHSPLHGGVLDDRCAGAAVELGSRRSAWRVPPRTGVHAVA